MDDGSGGDGAGSDSNDESGGISISIEMLQDIKWILLLGLGVAAVGCICCVLLVFCVRCKDRGRGQKQRRNSMEKVESGDVVGYAVTGCDVREDRHSPLSVKKSTYSTVSVGDGEEVFLEHAQGVQAGHIAGVESLCGQQQPSSGSFRRNMQNESAVMDAMMDGIVDHMATPIGHEYAARNRVQQKNVLPPLPPPASAVEMGVQPHGSAPHSGSFRRNIQNESLAVDAMMDEIVGHMATPIGPDEDALYD